MGEAEGTSILNRFFRDSLTDKVVCKRRLEGNDMGAIGDLGGSGGTFLAEKTMDHAWCVQTQSRLSKGRSFLQVSEGQRGGRRPGPVESWRPLGILAFI